MVRQPVPSIGGWAGGGCAGRPYRRGMQTPRGRGLAVAASLVALVFVAACGGASSESGSGSAAGGLSGEPRIVAVGDIACAPNEAVTPTTCQQDATAALTARLDPQLVVALGDLQYESGEAADFEASWAESWGQFADRLAAVPGNHEYNVPDAAGYRDYLDQPRHGVREIGGWRLYLVDSNCEADRCAAETTWLTDDLAAHPTDCVAVAMHHPAWSSGAHGPQGFIMDLWKAMVDAGVDVALAGHDHDYERFSRLDKTGHTAADDEPGIRQFVVGTGGKSLYGFRDEIRSESEFHQNEQFGVLEMSLRPDGYDWSFVDTDGDTLDSGSDTCRA